VSAGANSFRIDIAPTPGIAPKIGQILSYDDWPMQITSVIDAGSGVYDLTVQMPVRKAIPADGVIYLGAWGIFEAQEGSGSPDYGLFPVSRPTLKFTEALRR
jgi:hypothetical protein